MPTKIIRYKCDFCKKNYASMGGARRHESTCFHNPANRSCVTCLSRDGWLNPKTRQPSKLQDEDRINWCFETEREIFVRSQKILGCPAWEKGDPEYRDDNVVWGEGNRDTP